MQLEAVYCKTETAITLLGQLIWASWLDLSEEVELVFVEKHCECVCLCVCTCIYGWGSSMRWDVGRAARWGGSLMDCAVTSRSAIYSKGAADERGAVNRPAGGVFHRELAFMKNTRTALPTAPPGPPWRMEKDAWQASSLFVNLNCSRSLTPEGNFAETAGTVEGEGGEEGGRGGGGGERKGQRGTPEGYLDLCIWPTD